MNDGSLEALFAKAREAKAPAPPGIPPGFATELWRQHRQRQQEERSAIRTGIVSVLASLVMLAALVGFNFDDLAGAIDDGGDPGELSGAVWDFAGN
ncbi:MAG TPA: hypothetical protein VGD78_10225 [Chthoniobacterales bacterium]